MDSTYHFIDTLVVKCQNATDSIPSMMSKGTADIAPAVTNEFDFQIVFSICVTVGVVVVIIALAFIWCYMANRKKQNQLAERTYWIALMKEYQKLALEHVKVREGSSFESSQYLDYIDKFIRQIDEHLKRTSVSNKKDAKTVE